MFHLLLAFAVGPHVPPRLDARGDPLPDGALLRVGSDRWRPADGGTFSPDGRWVAVATGPWHSARLYEAATGRPVAGHWARDEEPAGKALDRLGPPFAFSGDAKVLYWYNQAGTVRALRVPGMELLATFPQDGPLLQIGANRDGSELTTLGSNRRYTAATVWLTRNGKRVKELRLPDGHSRGALTPAGDAVAWVCREGGGPWLRLTDVRTGKTVWERAGEWEPRRFSPDGATLFVEARPGRSYRAIDARTGSDLETFDHDGHDMPFSPSRKTFLTWSRAGGARLRDAATGKPTATPVIPSDERISRAAFADDRTVVISGPITRWFDVRTGKPPAGARPRGEVQGLSFTPDGGALILTERGAAVREVSLADGKEVRLFPVEVGRFHPNLAAVTSPDGRLVAGPSGREKVTVWDRKTGKPLHVLAGREREMLLQPLAFAPDGRSLHAAGPKAGTCWDVTTGKLLGPTGWALFGHRHSAPTADGKEVIACDNKGRLTWLDPATGKAADRWKAAAPDPQTFAVMPGGKEVAVVVGGEIQFREAATGKPIRAIKGVGHVSRLSASPDGNHLVGTTFEIVRLWEVGTGRELRPVPAHRSVVWWAGLSPDGRRLVTAGHDHQVLVWDAEALTGERVAFALPPAVWRRRWEELGGPSDFRRWVNALWLHAALEQTLAEAPAVISHERGPENVRRAAAARELLRRIGTKAALGLLARLDEAPAGSPWRKP